MREASDTAGVWALLAASQMDKSKLAGVRIERAPHSVRQAYESPIHRALHDVTMPGFAASFDLDDVVKLVGADKVEWWDPMDWMRNRVPVDRPWIRYTKFGH